MLVKLNTFSLLGIDAVPVEVEVDCADIGMPKIILVGLPEAAVKESTYRIERAIENSGYFNPIHRTVINLAPADLPKQAASFDLPISLGMLAGTGQIPADAFDRFAVVGELALDGTMRPIKGALSIALSAKALGISDLIVPAEKWSCVSENIAHNCYKDKTKWKFHTPIAELRRFAPTKKSQEKNSVLPEQKP